MREKRMLFKWNSRIFQKTLLLTWNFDFLQGQKKKKRNFSNDFWIIVYVFGFYVMYTYVKKYDKSDFMGFNSKELLGSYYKAKLNLFIKLGRDA